MNVDLTIAIPTFNGAQRLPLLLERLRSQHTPSSLTWEILIIDNNSQDNTAALVHSYQATWKHPIPLRYEFEPKQGLAWARQCAVQSARGELIGFLDDDNLPASDWVEQAYQFGCQYPQVGAFGSKIRALFEQPPPDALKPLLFYLAIVDRGDRPIPYHPRRTGVPPGAGLVVRRSAWLHQVPNCLFLIGRVGSSMLPGEDSEALLHLYQGGWEIWYNPAMVIDHQIAASRLQGDYFCRLLRGIGLSRHHLRMIVLPIWQRPLATILYGLSDSRKAISHFLRYRTVLTTNLYAACEMQRLWGTMISPFYLGKLRLERTLASLMRLVLLKPN